MKKTLIAVLLTLACVLSIVFLYSLTRPLAFVTKPSPQIEIDAGKVIELDPVVIHTDELYGPVVTVTAQPPPPTPPVKRKQLTRVKTGERKWVCKEPVDLWQGSGSVKSCEMETQ
jgi:hypothetical protein